MKKFIIIGISLIVLVLFVRVLIKNGPVEVVSNSNTPFSSTTLIMNPTPQPVTLAKPINNIPPKNDESVFCTMDTKLCLDGSYVSRSGPRCEFKACPLSPEVLTPALIGERIAIQGIFITPLSIIEDSRCPASAQCIWAGKVQLRAKFEVALESKEVAVEIGTPETFMNKQIILTHVSPEKNTTTSIKEGEYVFTFSVK